MLVLTAAPASAQDEGGSPFSDFSELDGLEAGVNRSYVLDFSQFEALPADSEEAGDIEYRDVLTLAGAVFEFDSSPNSAAAYGAFLDHGIEPPVTMLGFEDPTITEGDVEDLGDQAFAYSVFNDTGTTEGYYRYTFMRQDAYLCISIISAETEESSLDGDALLAFFAEETDEGHSGPGALDEAGGSTGGLWEFYPDADHELWEGLIPGGDEVFFPETDNGV